MLISRFPNYNAEERIIELENKFNISLPTQYRKFLCKYNGGDTPETRYKAGRNSSDLRAFYGFGEVGYSVDKFSDFYLLKHNNLPFDKYVRIADNGCGDYYVLCIENGKCLEPLFFYDHESGKTIPTEYEDVFEYLVKLGLKKNFP